ncbi:MAG: cytochrome P450 [Caldilineaceae bacterium]|nr:cytochrome P450 [Caldilineaceae bacterium]
MTIQLNNPSTVCDAPGPKGLPILGNVLRFGNEKNILFHFIDLWREYGDVAHVKLGSQHIYVVVEPEHVHHVLVKNPNNYIKGNGYTGFRLLVGQGLVTSDGDLWRNQRRLMQPSFTPKSIVQFFDMMVETTERMLERWNPSPDLAMRGGSVLHIDAQMMRLTMSIISKAIFGVDLGVEAAEVGEAFHDAFAFVTARTMSAVALPLSLPLPAHRRFQRSLQIIDDFVGRQIASGRGQSGDTLLSILLQARDEETGERMSERQLRDEVVTLFLAGFETTARSLTWGWYLLSRNPDVQERLIAEVDAVLGGRLPSVDDLFRLSYTHRVVDETLRLYPPTALLGRQIVADDQIGDYRVQAGGIVMLVPYLTHRLPSVWPDPERFDPERFRPEIAARPKSAYIPFISGPRICLGNNFALMEMTLAFALTAQRYRLESTTEAEIGVAFRGSTCPTAPLHLTLHPLR